MARQSVTLDIRSTSPMYPIAYQYEAGGLYYYSGYCCQANDPHYGQIVSSVPLNPTQSGCPDPPQDLLGVDRQGGCETRGLENRVPIKIEGDMLNRAMGDIPTGGTQNRSGISFGFFLDSTTPAKLPPNGNLSRIGGGCKVEEYASFGNSTVVFNDDSNAAMFNSRQFRIEKIEDVMFRQVFIVARAVQNAGTPKILKISKFKRHEQTTQLLKAHVAAIPTIDGGHSGPHYDLLILDYK